MLSSAGRVGCLSFDVVGDQLLLYFREAVIVMIREILGTEIVESKVLANRN